MTHLKLLRFVPIEWKYYLAVKRVEILNLLATEINIRNIVQLRLEISENDH